MENKIDKLHRIMSEIPDRIIEELENRIMEELEKIWKEKGDL